MMMWNDRISTNQSSRMSRRQYSQFFSSDDCLPDLNKLPFALVSSQEYRIDF